jgi:hypothetical protein
MLGRLEQEYAKYISQISGAGTLRPNDANLGLTGNCHVPGV